MSSCPVLPKPSLIGSLSLEATPAPLAGGAWYASPGPGAGWEWRFPAGTLQASRYLSADVLLDGQQLLIWSLELATGDGPTATRANLNFGALAQCQARLRIPLSFSDQSTWSLGRQAAWLKITIGGARLDPAQVTLMRLKVLRQAATPARFCLTPLTLSASPAPLLTEPLLPRGPLLDEFGQSTLHDWPAKTRSAAELTARLQSADAQAAGQPWPSGWTRWGGCQALHLRPGTGFFGTHHDGRRWWLVDPEGYAFWSTGMDCVRADVQASTGGLAQALTWAPPHSGDYAEVWGQYYDSPTINYLAANYIRVFGADWRAAWERQTLAFMRRTGLNTVANWSDWQMAQRHGFPYVRPLNEKLDQCPRVFRDFPDVFHESFPRACAAYAEQLRPTRDDPAFIGYFLMNEPHWGFASELPATGMLRAYPAGPMRQALAEFLLSQHGSEAALASAWETAIIPAAIAAGPWTGPLNRRALADLEAFSSLMVKRLFDGLSAACRAVDPQHLNLGARYYTVPPPWAVAGMSSFDVFSINGYSEKVRRDLIPCCEQLGRPALIGEWHFGALDVGLPGSGIGHVATQHDRGRAFRVYTEDAASLPQVIGVHYFTLYDESALGRFDGENWNIGLLDVCARPYEPLVAAATAAHRVLYEVAAGQRPPYADAPRYLPLLFN